MQSIVSPLVPSTTTLDIEIGVGFDSTYHEYVGPPQSQELSIIDVDDLEGTTTRHQSNLETVKRKKNSFILTTKDTYRNMVFALVHLCTLADDFAL